MSRSHSQSHLPGPAPRTADQELFAKLIAQGVSNSQACRTVDINRRTGTRWRYGRQITNRVGRVLQYPGMI